MISARTATVKKPAITPGAPTLEEHAGEQALIAAVREARRRGLSQRAVVAELSRQGFTTRKGTPLRLTQVQRLVKV